MARMYQSIAVNCPDCGDDLALKVAIAEVRSCVEGWNVRLDTWPITHQCLKDPPPQDQS